MHFVTSKDNNTIKEVRKLKEKKHRTEKKKFIVEGFRFLEEGLKSEFEAEKIIVRESVLDKYKERFSQYMEQYDDCTIVVDDNIFKTVASTENSQGVLAVFKMADLRETVGEGLFILADKVQDPGNLGTILRTAHSAGCTGVILTEGTVDIYNEKTLRSTMGSIFHVPVIHEKRDLNYTKELIESGFELVCSSLQTDKNFYDIDLKGKTIIAVGNEGNGISDDVMNLATKKVKIPMIGSTESLNVAIAASIMTYESVRQRLTDK